MAEVKQLSLPTDISENYTQLIWNQESFNQQLLLIRLMGLNLQMGLAKDD